MEKGKVSIGIDVHKRKCVVCVMDDADGHIREETAYENTRHHATQFAKDMNKRYGKGNCKAVCESTGNM